MIETNPLPGNRALFEISDLMRGLRIAGDELYALPFLCMLIEEVGLNQVGPRTDRNAIIRMLTGFSSRSAAHQQACDWFQNIIPRIPDSELSDIVVRLKNWLSHVDIKAARVLILALLQAVPSRAWRVTGPPPFSKELLTFMVDLARIPDGGNVQVPYPPSFSLPRFLPSTATAHFEVASEHEAGIFAIHEIITESKSSFKVADNRLEKSISGKQFSTVIAAPPFNGRTQGPGAPAEITCITQAMETLKDGGRAVICVTPGFLMRSGRWKAFREHLTSSNALECVIQLPPRLLEGTSKPSIPGKPISSSTTSGRNSAASVTASGPVWAIRVVWPRISWSIAMLSAESRLSSTLSMRSALAWVACASGSACAGQPAVRIGRCKTFSVPFPVLRCGPRCCRRGASRGGIRWSVRCRGRLGRG